MSYSKLSQWLHPQTPRPVDFLSINQEIPQSKLDDQAWIARPTVTSGYTRFLSPIRNRHDHLWMKPASLYPK